MGCHRGNRDFPGRWWNVGAVEHGHLNGGLELVGFTLCFEAPFARWFSVWFAVSDAVALRAVLEVVGLDGGHFYPHPSSFLERRIQRPAVDGDMSSALATACAGGRPSLSARW